MNIDKNKTIGELVREYAANNNIFLCILTPCYGGMCHINYTISLMSTIEAMKEYGIRFRVEFCKNDSLVSRARNNLIAKAMAVKDITHFLFIDSDIMWSPVEIFKLIISDKDLCGGLYPIKNYQWNKLTENKDVNVVNEWLEKKNKFEILKNESDDNIIKYHLLRYNMNVYGGDVKIENNMIRIKHLATGFMMIKRNVIDKLMQAFPSTKYIDDVGFLNHEENNYAYALFDCGVEDNHYMSEDWLFCNRWSKIGGSVYADITINLVHSGTENYNGSILATLL
jgi:hypothetical protein